MIRREDVHVKVKIYIYIYYVCCCFFREERELERVASLREQIRVGKSMGLEDKRERDFQRSRLKLPWERESSPRAEVSYFLCSTSQTRVSRQLCFCFPHSLPIQRAQRSHISIVHIDTGIVENKASCYLITPLICYNIISHTPRTYHPQDENRIQQLP